MKYLMLVIASTCLLSCNETSSTLNIDTFNSRMIYFVQSCNNDITVYTQNIKNEHHEINDFLTEDKSVCSVDYELSGKPLKYRSTSMNTEQVYHYAPDGSDYEIRDNANKLLATFSLTKNDNGQVIQKSLNAIVADYGYNKNNQLYHMVMNRDGELVMTYTYQWGKENILSSCFIKDKLVIYTEYADHGVISYKMESDLDQNDLSCEQVKQKYISNDYDKLNPITQYSSQCEQTDEQGNCIYSKSFVNGVLINEKHSSYEYY